MDIKFRDLSIWLKIAALGGIFYAIDTAIIFIYGFCVGFFGAI